MSHLTALDPQAPEESLLAVPKSRLKSKGDRDFAMRVARFWNALPEEIRLAESVTFF